MPKMLWSKERVIAAIQDRQRKGLNMLHTYREDPFLYHAACRRFGSWHRASLAAGVVVPRRRQWSPERVLEVIRQRQQRGLKMTGVAVEDGALYFMARKYFGGWYAAVRAAGLEPQVRQTWSKERVIEALRAWQRTHGTVRGIWKEKPTLVSTARRYFGNLRRAPLAAGLTPYWQRWTRQRVLDALRAHVDSGASVAALRQNPPLFGATRLHFGSCPTRS